MTSPATGATHLAETPALLVVHTVDGALSLQDLLTGLRGHKAVVIVVDDDPPRREALVEVIEASGLEAVGTDRATRPEELVARLGTRAWAGAMTFAESTLRLTDVLAERLGLSHNGTRTITALTDKREQRRLLSAAGVPCPVVRTLTHPDDWPEVRRAVSGPCVVKPARGFGSASTFGLDDGDTTLPEAVIDGLLAAVPFVVESRLVGVPRPPFGDYVSVESVVTSGTVRHLAVTGKLPLVEPFRETGQFIPADLTGQEHLACLEMTGRALQALGVQVGICHTELKLTPEGPRVIEVNGRLGGYIGDLLRRGLGLDPVALAVAAAQGVPGPAQDRTPGGVVLNWTSLPPVEARVVLGIDGVPDVRTSPGVVGYVSYVRPGHRLRADGGTEELDVLRAGCETTAEVVPTLRRALGHLRVQFADADGSRSTWSGADLPGGRAL